MYVIRLDDETGNEYIFVRCVLMGTFFVDDLKEATRFDSVEETKLWLDLLQKTWPERNPERVEV